MLSVRPLLPALMLGTASAGAAQAPVGQEGAALRQAMGAGRVPVAQEGAALRQVLERGTRLYAYDRAAWIGSDALAAANKSLLEQLGGWIVDGPIEAPEIVFHDRSDADPRALYIVTFKDGRLASQRAPTPAEGALSPARKSLIAAKRAATSALIAGKAGPCGNRPFNSVVLPPDRPGEPILVYFLTPQSKSDVVPIGGHFLVPVSEGGSVGPLRRFATTCLALATREPGKPAPTALAVSHRLDPVPTEMHVFSSLAARLPIVVVTVPNEQAWIIDGARTIRKLPPPIGPVNDLTTIRRLYGRRSGHKLRGGQAALVEQALPAWSVPDEGPITATSLFGDDRPLHFEIGFGSGEHLACRADLLPDHGFIGCEPFLNGVVGALGHVRDRNLTNVRLHMGDALDVLERLPDASLRFVYLLHPDPWPKARHAKRRMINPGPLDLIAAKLEPGGEFRLGTDDPTYCRWSMMVMSGRRDFEWLAESAADFLTRPGGWPETRYEAKARRKGHEVWYFRYRRL